MMIVVAANLAIKEQAVVAVHGIDGTLATQTGSSLKPKDAFGVVAEE